MSDYAPQTLAELRAHVAHGGPLSAGRWKNVTASTVYVMSAEVTQPELFGPLADDVRASREQLNASYRETGSRARPVGTVAYYVSAWMSSRHGAGWHPFAAVLADGDTWSTIVWPDARSTIGGVTQGVYDAITGGVDAFALSLIRNGGSDYY